MPGNMGQTSVLGYDEDGNKKWFEGGIPKGYTGSPPEIREPEIPDIKPQESESTKSVAAPEPPNDPRPEDFMADLGQALPEDPDIDVPKRKNKKINIPASKK